MGKILDRNKFKAERSGVFAQIFVVSAQDSVPRRPLPPQLTNLLASSLPCFVIVALSILSGRGQSQGIGKPAAHVAGFGREDFASADAVIRAKPQPGGKVL
jgi:hypothetical protein